MSGVPPQEFFAENIIPPTNSTHVEILHRLQEM
jgi:hypothetical protein